MSRSKFRLAAAAVSALAFCSLSIAPAAFADLGAPTKVGGVDQQNTSNPALINPTASVQLDIHKYLGAPTGGTNNGTEQTISGLPALQGVNFDVYKVGGVDLTTNAGWTAATALSNYKITATDITNGYITVGGVQYQLTKVSTVTTGSTGTAVFTQTNGVGLYLVNENLASSGTITNLTTNTTVDKATITPSSPFLVTLPMTNPANTAQWMYDVNVYPKNQSDTATKSVLDKGTVTSEGTNVGNHAIQFTINTSITAGMTGTQMGMYQVIDTLDSRLAYDTTKPATATIDQPGPLGQLTAADYTVTVTGQTVTVSMNQSGLDKLASAKAAHPTAQVVTVINTTVTAEGVNGLIPNQATFIPNQTAYNQNNNGIPTNQTKTYYGDVVINKQDPTDTANKAAMDGAVFAIYADPTPGDGTCSASDVSGTPIASQTISGGTATVTFKGLQASNWYNNAEQTALLSYCLVETKAPTGYNLDATPHYITIDYKTQTTTAPAFATELVNNEKSNLNNNLPLTGGAGVAALSLAGLALVGGGAAYYIVSSRKRREQDV